MIKKIILALICSTLCSCVYAARDKVLEEHVNNEIAFYNNIKTCTPIESAEPNFNASRKIYGQEENNCHFMYRNNIDCKIPMTMTNKLSEVGLRIYNDYSDYGMITSTTSDIKYLDNEVLYNARYCRVK